MSIVIGIILVVLVVVFSVATYGMLAYNDFSVKQMWQRGWSMRLRALFVTYGLLLSIKNLITL